MTENVDINQRLETVAACLGCGRGFIHIAYDGIRCPACAAPIRLLPAREVANDDACDRQRWKALVATLPPVKAIR